MLRQVSLWPPKLVAEPALEYGAPAPQHTVEPDLSASCLQQAQKCMSYVCHAGNTFAACMGQNMQSCSHGDV